MSTRASRPATKLLARRIISQEFNLRRPGHWRGACKGSRDGPAREEELGRPRSTSRRSPWGRRPAAKDSPAELTEREPHDAVLAGLYLMPFSVIAFLWFIAVIRRRIGEREDRFFATVFLGSGLLFAALTLVVSSVTAGAAVASDTFDTVLPDAGDVAVLQGIGRSLTTLSVVRLAGVFVLSTSTLILRTRALPTWLGIIGYPTAVGLLVNPFGWTEAALIFPSWVILVSVVILVRRKTAPAVPGGASSAT